MTTLPETMPYTYEQVLKCKDITEQLIKKDYKALCDFPADTNPRKFCGNKILYHYQMKNILACKRGNKGWKTLEEWFADPELKEKLWKDTIKRNRRKKATVPSPTDVYECHRINNGAIVFFKSSTAKYIYKKFNAKNVLDPTAGWGGRMLAAMSLGINYTGYDTNINMREAYSNMVRVDNADKNVLETPHTIQAVNKKGGVSRMVWLSCIDGATDFSKNMIGQKYDLVLTSPPYGNMELYEHMEAWKNDNEYFTDFLVPLMNKLFKETNCPVCINISPRIYHKLTSALNNYGIRACDEEVDLRQQLGKQYKTKSQDLIYVWYPETD
tara:strand:- start:108 stop:1085 length:978 start_codon:yes stop_codon:yes gene_type:complete